MLKPKLTNFLRFVRRFYNIPSLLGYRFFGFVYHLETFFYKVFEQFLFFRRQNQHNYTAIIPCKGPNVPVILPVFVTLVIDRKIKKAGRAGQDITRIQVESGPEVPQLPIFSYVKL